MEWLGTSPSQVSAGFPCPATRTTLGAHIQSLHTSSFTPMQTITAKHVSDASRDLGPFSSVDEAIDAIHASGGHVLKIDDWSRVVWSDYPRKSLIPPVLNTPTIALTLLLDRP